MCHFYEQFFGPFMKTFWTLSEQFCWHKLNKLWISFWTLFWSLFGQRNCLWLGVWDDQNLRTFWNMFKHLFDDFLAKKLIVIRSVGGQSLNTLSTLFEHIFDNLCVPLLWTPFLVLAWKLCEPFLNIFVDTSWTNFESVFEHFFDHCLGKETVCD